MNTRLTAAGFLPSLSKTPGGLLDCASPPSILPFCKMLFAKRLPDKPFRAAGYWIRELRFAAACGRRRQSAVSVAAPLAGRSKAGPPMAMRQGEQGALPPRAPPLLCRLTLQRGFLTVSETAPPQQVMRQSRSPFRRSKDQPSPAGAPVICHIPISSS